MRRRLVMVATIVAVVVPVAAVAQPAPHTVGYYELDEAALAFDAVEGHEDAQRLWGTVASAGYRIEVPADWNGDLVMYAHGYRGEGTELTVSNPPIREHLLDQGYAWAASSYARNGYAVGRGVTDTVILQARFGALVGTPERVYLMGHSMGGHITGVAIEWFPWLYDGALPMCGVMGDRELFDYFLDYNLVAQQLAGVAATFPPSDDYMTATVPTIKRALWDTFPAAPNDAGLALAGLTQQRSGGDRPLFDVAFGAWADFLFTVNGDGTLTGLLDGNLAGNVGRTYQLDGDPALSDVETAINDQVLRVRPDRLIDNWRVVDEVPEIRGRITMPVLTLHTIGDLFVPLSMEQSYAREVAAQGRSRFLVQRVIRDVEHCGFTLEEQTQAFDDLVRWVEGGIRPHGDRILDAAAVAAPDYGCRFTLAARPYDPGCP